VNERVEILLSGHHIAKNILQHQEVVESLAELWKAIRIPSSVMTFAVIHSLVLMRQQNFSINWEKGCSPDHGSFPSPSINVYGLAYLAWKQVVFAGQ